MKYGIKCVKLGNTIPGFAMVTHCRSDCHHFLLGATLTMNDVGIIMGSKSDWNTLVHTASQLTAFGVSFGYDIVSAHRTPDLMSDYAKTARKRGLKVIIAGAGGAAHLPGMVAAQTTLPVIGVPIQSNALNGLDSLLSIVQMPAGIPVATVAIGEAGAKNAALLAISILATTDTQLQSKLETFRLEQAKSAVAFELKLPNTNL